MTWLFHDCKLQVEHIWIQPVSCWGLGVPHAQSYIAHEQWTRVHYNFCPKMCKLMYRIIVGAVDNEDDDEKSSSSTTESRKFVISFSSSSYLNNFHIANCEMPSAGCAKDTLCLSLSTSNDVKHYNGPTLSRWQNTVSKLWIIFCSTLYTRDSGHYEYETIKMLLPLASLSYNRTSNTMNLPKQRTSTSHFVREMNEQSSH